jgi:hypothetical protein
VAQPQNDRAGHDHAKHCQGIVSDFHLDSAFFLCPPVSDNSRLLDLLAGDCSERCRYSGG